jgi:hypothetical protein
MIHSSFSAFKVDDPPCTSTPSKLPRPSSAAVLPTLSKGDSSDSVADGGSLSSVIVRKFIKTKSHTNVKYLIQYLMFVVVLIGCFEFGFYMKTCPNRRITAANYLIPVNQSNSTVEQNTVGDLRLQKPRLVDYETDSTVLKDLKEQEKLTEQVTYLHDTFENIKNAQLAMFESVNVSVRLCTAEPPDLQGEMNFDVLFKNNTFSSMIEFYEKIEPLKTSTAPNLLSNETIKKYNNSLSLLNGDVYGPDVKAGGFWTPQGCESRHRIGVIIPYRNRFVHLAVLLRHLHFVLQRQQIEYRLFVTEQYGNVSKPFNKGRIMNAAFIEALKINEKIDCFVFHDVDLVPEDDRNMYTCPQQPRHMSVAIDKFKYKLPYSILVGGVFVLKKQHFTAMNG